jgi:hypothetical protein
MNRFSYARPRLAWIKRRARCFVRNFPVSRRSAVEQAAEDYRLFVGRIRPALTLVRGGL